MMSRISFKILEEKKTGAWDRWRAQTIIGAGWQVDKGSLQCFLYFDKYLKSSKFF